MFAKFDADCVNEEFKAGYYAGLMMDTKSTQNRSADFHRGYHTAMTDVIELEPENCC